MTAPTVGAAHTHTWTDGATPITAAKLTDDEADIAALVAAHNLLATIAARTATPVGSVGYRAGTYDPVRSLYLPASSSLQKLRARIAAAAAAGSQVHMLCAGDSKTAGSGVGAENSWPRQLRALLSAAGIPVVGTGICPAALYGIDNALDSRWSVTGTWAGGTSWLQTATSGNTLTFTSNVAGTVVDVFYFNNSGGFTVTIDGAAPVPVTPTGTNTVGKYTVTGLTNTTHTVKITTTTATTVYFIGVNVYPTTGGLMIHNAGFPGIASAGWSNTAFPSVAFAYLGMLPTPGLMAVALGTNDPPNSITAASTKSYLQGVLTAFSNPATLLICESWTNIAGSGWGSYESAIYDLGDSANLPVLDLADRWGTAANAASLGILGGDSSHESIAGHADVARVVARVLA